VSKQPKRTTLSDLRAAARASAEQPYELCLYIAGTTSTSSSALANLIALCDERLPGRYELSVIDVYQEPERARADQIVVVPTLLKRQPAPVRRLIGDLSDTAVVLHGLGLEAVNHGEK
jgi:circadian clock protein KaiB